MSSMKTGCMRDCGRCFCLGGLGARNPHRVDRQPNVVQLHNVVQQHNAWYN